MPVAQVQMFLAVALNQGASLTELAVILDMKKSTASRYLLDLSEMVRSGERGVASHLQRGRCSAPDFLSPYK